MGKKDKGDKGPGVGDLCQAAANGNIGEIRKIINAGVKVDKGDYDKRTALHIACAEGKLPVVRRMVEELHAKTTVKDSWGGTPLDDALRAGHQAISDFLLSKGAPVGKNGFAMDDAGVLCTAGAQGNAACILGLSRRGVDVNTADYDKRTAIHLACSEGKLEAVKTLVSLKANVDPADRFGGTPLDDAQRKDHKEVIAFLKVKNASSGKGGAVSTQDAADLCDAASSGNLNKLREIVARGVDSNAGDYDLRTAIHLAAAEGLKDVLMCLFDELEGNPNVVDRWGGTPLDDARRAGHDDIIGYLASKGAVRGKTTLHDEDADILIDAVMTDDFECFRGMASLKDASRAPLESMEADMSAGNADKRTALHVAAAEGKLECVQELINLGAFVNAKDRWGNTPLDDAVFFQRTEVADFLREKGGHAGRQKKSEGGGGPKKKKKKAPAAVGDGASKSEPAPAKSPTSESPDDSGDKSTVAPDDQDHSQISGDSHGSGKVSSWGFHWCTNAQPNILKFMQRDLFAGLPATLQLHLKKPLESECRVKVTLSGPVVLMGVLDKQPPSTRCIELQFDLRLAGEYALEVVDNDSGELFLKDEVTVHPNPKDDARAVN